MIAGWLFAGSRAFEIEPVGDGRVRFTHVEQIRGLLVPAFRALMGSAIQRGHDAFDAALKARAETGVVTRAGASAGSPQIEE